MSQSEGGIRDRGEREERRVSRYAHQWRRQEEIREGLEED